MGGLGGWGGWGGGGVGGVGWGGWVQVFRGLGLKGFGLWVSD